MSSMAVELGDLDRVKEILSKLNNDGLYHSSRLEHIRDNYRKHVNKSKISKFNLNKIYADTTTIDIIKEQNLTEFLPENTKPARYDENSFFCFNYVF